MDDLSQLMNEARATPTGRDQVAILRRAVEVADSLGDLDAAFEARVELVEAIYYTEEATVGLTEFAWLQARMKEHPGRWERFERMVGWMNKWMPGYACHHPQVPMARLVSLVDELEERHVAAGSGRRQAIAVRMRLRSRTGVGPDLEELLVDWRSSARTSLTDCALCEADLEADVLDELGRRDEAMQALDPYFRGEIGSCSGGPSSILRVAVGLLIEADRLDEARTLFGRVLREAEGSTEDRRLSDLAGCAMLLARTGDRDAARRIAIGVLPMLGRAGNPDQLMWMSAELARALAPFDEDEPVPGVGDVHGIGGPPAGGWTMGSLRAALAGQAVALSAKFDDRNGTAVTSGRIRATLDHDDLPSVSLRGTARGIDADPDADATAPAGGAAAMTSAPPTVEPTRPAPDPGEGPLALDAWAREQFDNWRPDVCWGVLAERHDTVDDPTTATITLAWLLGTEHAPDVHAAPDLVVDDRVAPNLRARLAAVLARLRADSGVSEDVAPLTDLALAIVSAGQAEPVAAMRILRNVAEAALAVGDTATASRAFEVGLALDLTDPMAAFLLDALLLVVANGARSAHDSADHEAAEADERAAVRAADVLEAADDVLGDGPIGPLVVFAIIDATSTLMDLGPTAPSPEPLERAVAGIPELVSTGPPRAQAELLLADVHLRIDGPAAAMVRQRRAIAAIEEHGPPGFVGWARRGLAFQLQQLGRHDEALVQFAMAVDLLFAGGDVVDAWTVEAARARCLLEAGEAERAANVADDVLAQVDEAEGMPDELRLMVLEPTLDVAVDAQTAIGAHRRASLLLERFAGLMAETGRSGVMALAAAALSAGRGGDVDRADALLAGAEAAAFPDLGPERDFDLALVDTRRAELLWQRDHNDEATVVAADAEAAALGVGDERLAAFAASIGARARHDAYLLLREEEDPSAGAAGDDAVDDLVRAIQVAQAVDLDDLATHLGERLEELRSDLDRPAG